jgi:hypothetical protein
MDRIEDRDEEIVELGVASEDTKGNGTLVADLPGSISVAGILDD